MTLTPDQARFILLCVELCIAYELLPEQELAEALNYLQQEREI